jgi:hypothetical protein
LGDLDPQTWYGKTLARTKNSTQRIHLRSLVPERKWHLRSVNVKYSLSWSSNNKSCKIKVVDRKRLRRSTKVCKCICAQLLKCANGCTVYYLFCPSHTKSGGQGLPRTIAIAIAQKDIYQRIFISYILSKNREKGYSPITFLSGIC